MLAAAGEELALAASPSLTLSAAALPPSPPVAVLSLGNPRRVNDQAGGTAECLARVLGDERVHEEERRETRGKTRRGDRGGDKGGRKGETLQVGTSDYMYRMHPGKWTER